MASLRQSRLARSLLTRTAAILALALVLLGILGALVPSVLLRSTVSDFLAARGLVAEGLDDVRLNLYRLSLTTGPLRITRADAEKGGKSGADDNSPNDNSVVRLDGLTLYLRLTPLATRHVDVRGVMLKGLTFTIAEDARGQYVLRGLPAPAGGAARRDASSAWLFGLSDLSLESGTILLETRAVRGRLRLDRLSLANFKSWSPDNPGTVTLEGQLNGAAVTLSGTLAPLAADALGDLHLTIRGLPLKSIAAADPVTGRLGADVRIKALIRQSGAVSGNLAANVTVATPRLVTRDGLAIQGDRLAISRITGTLATGPQMARPELRLRGGLALDGLRYRSPDGFVITARRAAIDRIDSSIRGGRGDRDPYSIAANGKLTLTAPTAATSDGVTLKAERLALTRLDGALTVTPEGDARDIRAAGALDVEKLALTAPDGLAMAATGLTLSDFRGHLKRDPRGSKTVFTGRLAIARPHVATAAGLTAESIGLGLDRFEATVVTPPLGTRGAAATRYAASGDLHVRDHELRRGEALLSAAKAIDARRFRYENDRLTLPALIITEGRSLSSPGHDDAFARFAALRLDDLTYGMDRDKTGKSKQPTLHVRAAAIDGLGIVATRARSGIIEIAGLPATGLPATGKPPAQPERTAADDSAAPLRYRLDSLVVGSGSRIAFTDETLHIPTRFNLTVERFALGAIDSAAPLQHTALDFAATVNEFSKLGGTGWVTPLTAPRLGFDLAIDLRNADLPRLSPYVVPMLGLNLRSGQLDAVMTARSDGDRLDGLAKITLRHMRVESLSDYDKRALARKVDMPVETAINLLKDSKGRISLTVPVSGSLGDPSFDMSDAMSQAISGAVEGAVVGALKIVFPIALLAKAARSGKKLLFDPVAFAPGTDSLAPEASAYLDRVATLMRERPGVDVGLCGRATAADLAALRAAAPASIPALILDKLPFSGKPKPGDPATEDETGKLVHLAQSRSDAAKRYLGVTHGIPGERLYECRSTYEAGDSIPRVEIRL